MLRRAWAAASRADEDAMLREFHPEIVAVPFGAARGARPTGPGQLLGWWRDEIMVNWEFFQVLPQTFQRVGHGILVTGRWNAQPGEAASSSTSRPAGSWRSATARSRTGEPIRTTL